MIKFFRQIRKSLFLENPPERKNRAGKTGSSTEAPAKVGKYLKYAIGEIVLVVIGILIALQINNWNQKRLSRIDEKNILSALHNEFLENKIKLDSVTIIYESGLNANMVLMDLIGKSAEELQEYDLDSLFYASLPDSQIIFSNNTVKNIVQTGKQDIIENSEIVQLINQWEATTVLIKEREQTLKVWIDNHLFPLLNDYVAFKEIDHNGNMPWGGKSELKPDYYTLFHLLKYENVQDNVLWYHNKNLNGLKIANNVINKIINATKSYKKN
jgi:hypothetical protein